jgi:N-methyl-L-tryptophan oxidase
MVIRKYWNEASFLQHPTEKIKKEERITIQNTYEVIIVGAGSMGMSAGYHLAKSGVKVLMLDIFDPPHTNGSHHGETRLIRHAYAGNETYTRMVLRAQQLWDELAEETGKQLFMRTGVINMNTDRKLIQEIVEKSKRLGASAELLEVEEIRKRWPGLTPPDHYIGMYQPTSGIMLSEPCVLASKELALSHGATLMPYTRVQNIEIFGDNVAVVTDKGKFFSDQLIISAGAWSANIPGNITLPIKATRQTVAWFESDEALFGSDRFPGFTMGNDAGQFFGFPSIDGSGLKIGRHDDGIPWNPDEPLREFGAYAKDEEDLRKALAFFMPSANGSLRRGTACRYEMTPDENFIIDKHPEHSHVLLACGFSGHGFKFASVVGEMLRDMVTKGSTQYDLGIFSASRFATEEIN